MATAHTTWYQQLGSPSVVQPRCTTPGMLFLQHLGIIISHPVNAWWFADSFPVYGSRSTFLEEYSRVVNGCQEYCRVFFVKHIAPRRRAGTKEELASADWDEAGISVGRAERFAEIFLPLKPRGGSWNLQLVFSPTIRYKDWWKEKDFYQYYRNI